MIHQMILDVLVKEEAELSIIPSQDSLVTPLNWYIEIVKYNKDDNDNFDDDLSSGGIILFRGTGLTIDSAFLELKIDIQNDELKKLG